MKSQQKSKTTKSCPQAIQELIEQAKTTRMYLLKRAGPSSLKICDEDGNKFKVELSSTMICSCNQNNPHCIHTIHALLKVFQVDENNPIIWQQSYSQYEITNILNGSYKVKAEPIKKPVQVKQTLQQTVEVQQEENQNRQKVTEEDMCPICQESLLCNEALVYCKKQCMNNFHAKCMKVWVMQKQTAGKKINCPMCRVDWGETALVEIRQEEKNFENLHKTHNKVCHTCKISPIIGSLFTCISCPNCHMCEKCHSKKTHPHIFMIKRTRTENYEFLNNMSMNSLMHQFPENLQANSVETGGLMLVGMGFQKQSKCSFCQKLKQLRLLTCGHIVDEDCLRKMKEHHFICPIDHQSQFPGLFNMLTKEQKQFHLTETKKWNIIKEEDQQSHKLPPINRPSMNRPKQLSQRHFENMDPKRKQGPLPRQLSAKKQSQENPLQIKSMKQRIDFQL